MGDAALCDHPWMEAPRWDGDERGEGVADAGAFVRSAAELIDAMGRPNWVSEEPEVHLFPHIEQGCRTLPFEIVDASPSADGAFELRLRWTDDEWRVGHVRAAAFSLVGSFAEAVTYVRQRRDPAADAGDETLLFEIVTGILGDGMFAPHGHTVCITVTR